MGLGGGIGDEAFYAAKTFGEADEFYILQHLKGCFVAVGVEGEHGAGAAGLFEVNVPSGKIGKAGVEDFGDFRMVLQPLCQGLCIFWAASMRRARVLMPRVTSQLSQGARQPPTVL